MIYSEKYHKQLLFDNVVYKGIMPVNRLKRIWVFIKYSESAKKTVRYWACSYSGLKYCIEHYEDLRKACKDFITDDEKGGFDLDFPYDDLDWFFLPGAKRDIAIYTALADDMEKAERSNDTQASQATSATSASQASQDSQAPSAIQHKKAKRKAKGKSVKKAKPARVTNRQKVENQKDERIDRFLSETRLSIDLDENIRKIIRRGISHEPKKTDNVTSNLRFISIDIGVKNFATVCSNVFSPYTISGQSMINILEHYESYYNHTHYGRYYAGRGKTAAKNKAKKLDKRNELLENFIIKTCDRIMQNVKDDDIDTIICGYPDVWSRKITFSSTSVTTMFQRSLARFKEMLRKRCNRHGIKFVEIDESFTSVASFIDKDEMRAAADMGYSGKRVTRDKYITKSGFAIHADVNASYNIARKYLIKIKQWNDCYFTQMVALLNNSRYISLLKANYEESIEQELQKKEMLKSVKKRHY